MFFFKGKKKEATAKSAPAAPDTQEKSAPSVVMAAPETKDPEGLQLIFRAGEMIPFKHIWFVVTAVEKDAIVLRPRSVTDSFKKKREREKSQHGK